jgi:uncharacterized SAM-dependent methyltransferase
MLVLFLGSTLGNFNPERAEEFLADVRRLMCPGDAFYLSTDLQKEIPRLIAAYDDEVGVTAAFNLNLLARINRELKANFALPKFAHEARYDGKAHRIEMHLRSRVDQRVSIGNDFTIELRQDETIWTEAATSFVLKTFLLSLAGPEYACESSMDRRGVALRPKPPPRRLREGAFSQKVLQAEASHRGAGGKES